MNRFQPVVLAVIQKGDTFLFTKRIDDFPAYHGKWQLPGGGMEFGETPEEALHREVREELGIEVEIVRLIPLVDVAVRDGWQGIFLSYLCMMKDENAQFFLNEEASEFRFFTAKELVEMEEDVLNGCIEVIEAA